MSKFARGANGERVARWFGIAICGLTAAWLILPLVAIVPISFAAQDSFAFLPREWTLERYRSLADERWTGPLINSLLIAASTSLLCAVIGTLASFGIARSKSRWVGFVRLLVLAPQIVPIVVVGLAIYVVFLRWHLVGTWWAFTLAHTVLCLPFVVIPVTATLQAFDRTLELASASLGAGPLATFRQVTLPLIRPAVLSGSFLAFLGSFDDLVVSLFLQSPTFLTMPVQLYRSMTDTIDPTVAAVATIQIALVIAGVLVKQVIDARKLASKSEK